MSVTTITKTIGTMTITITTMTTTITTIAKAVSRYQYESPKPSFTILFPDIVVHSINRLDSQ